MSPNGHPEIPESRRTAMLVIRDASGEEVIAAALKAEWDATVAEVLAEATLEAPKVGAMQSGGSAAFAVARASKPISRGRMVIARTSMVKGVSARNWTISGHGNQVEATGTTPDKCSLLWIDLSRELSLAFAIPISYPHHQ